jgi:hypothetical protein
MSEHITVDELMRELAKFEPTEDAEGMTTPELCEACNKGDKWVRDRIRQGLKAGTIRQQRALRRAIDGRMVHVPVYVRVGENG